MEEVKLTKEQIQNIIDDSIRRAMVDDYDVYESIRNFNKWGKDTQIVVQDSNDKPKDI